MPMSCPVSRGRSFGRDPPSRFSSTVCSEIATSGGRVMDSGLVDGSN